MSEMEVKRYGCSKREIDEAMDNYIGGKQWFVESLLSKAQDYLEAGRPKLANKFICRAKYALLRKED